jgi:hypothetical protein
MVWQGLDQKNAFILENAASYGRLGVPFCHHFTYLNGISILLKYGE